jgi:hypothetical protein
MGKMQATTDPFEHGGSRVFQMFAVANVEPKLTYSPQTPLFRLLTLNPYRSQILKTS